MLDPQTSHSTNLIDSKQESHSDHREEDHANEGMSDTVTTTSDCGSSVMTPDSFDDEVCKDKSSACESENGETCCKQETLLIFDYDDTLFPTSFLAHHGYRLDGPDASPDIQAVLDDYSEFVEKSLLEASEHGQVVILTNAETGWIELTSQKFLPRLSELLVTFPLVSARSTYEPLGITSPFQWKLKAFDSVIGDHFASHGTKSMRNVLSFGDSVHERDAAHQVCSKLSRTVCKSIKFMERPDVAQLIKQHSLIRECLEQIVEHDGTLDLCIQCQLPGGESSPTAMTC